VFLFILSNGWRDLSRPRADEIKVLREEKGNWEQKSNGAMESSRAHRRLSLIQISRSSQREMSELLSSF
jgi:hypothetical protein